MAEYTAIADVGRTLVKLLRDRMSTLIDASDVGLLSPDRVGSDPDVRLGLYLYKVAENAQMQNERPPVSGPTSRAGRPLRLDLRYLLTAYPPTGGSDESANTEEQHDVLGRAMQVLQDDSIITGSDLVGFDAGEALHVSILPGEHNEVVNMWTTFSEVAYQPSVAYLVTPVVIDSTHEEPAEPVVEREVVEHMPGPGPDEDSEDSENG